MTATETPVVPRLKVKYDTEVRQALKDQLGLANVMEVPKLEKIVLNMGVGAATAQASLLEGAIRDLTVIAGQKPVVTRAKKSIAGFKLREGNAIGAKVTLRGARMWEFLDRMITIAIPRIRDFRGLNPRSFDGRGNYSMGVREQLIFPEIDYDSIDQVRGLDVTITTTAQTDEEAFELLLGLGMPFREDGRPGQTDKAAEEAEEQRKEEARARAEAEQAALEQLKEENPEAYETPEPAEGEGEEGAEGGAEEATEGESGE